MDTHCNRGKKELASLALLDQEQLDQAFAGSPVVLMQDLSSDQAQRYEAALKTTGAVCQLLPRAETGSPPPTAAPPQAVSPVQGQKRITCPKCGFDQEEAPECFQCGVIIERFRERASFEEDEVARLAAAGIQLGPVPDEELVDDSFFAPEKKGLEKGMAGGIVMMVIAVVWFVAGWAAGIIFYYPPVLFLIGLFGFFKGLLSGNVAG